MTPQGCVTKASSLAELSGPLITYFGSKVLGGVGSTATNLAKRTSQVSLHLLFRPLETMENYFQCETDSL